MSNTKIKAGQFSGIVGHGTDGYFLMTNGDGTMAWAEGGATGPSVTSVSYPGDDLAADPTGGQTVVLTGTGFAASGMIVSIGGTAAPSVAHDSNTQLTITTPAKAAGDYDIVVTNTVTGASGTFVNGISYNGIPTWTTAAGSLGTLESETTISTITLQATEPDGGTITFNITNGALPTGLSLTGANIDGTTTAESSTTLYSFTIEAIDDENQASTPRNFFITVNASELIPSQNFTINTYTGNGSTQSIEGKIGTAASFNGSSSIISVSGQLPSVASDYSISFWANPTTISTSGNTIFTNINAGGSAVKGQVSVLFYDYNSVKRLRVYIITTTGSLATAVYDTTSAIATGTFSHIVVNIDIDGAPTSYVNGVPFAMPFLANTSVTSQGSDTIFGKHQNASFFNGKLDQVRIFNKAVSSGEVTTLYGENNASSTKSTTDIFDDGSGVALYEFKEGAKDTGSYLYGTGAIDSGQSAVFNGSNNRITKSPVTGFPGGNSARSVSVWVKQTVSNISQCILMWGTGSGNRAFALYPNYTQLTILTYGASVSTGYNFTLNQWTHIVVTHDGTTTKVYADGSLVHSFTYSYNTSTANFIIGNVSWSNVPFTGQIDQVRIYSSALSASDVEALASETNVPTANLVAHYKLDGNGNDETTNYNATSVSNVTYSDPAEFPLIAYNGTPTNVSFVGTSFQPDLVWLKNRDSAYSHRIFDSVRGADKTISSDATSAEYDGGGTGYMSSFDSNGFTLSSGNVNTNASSTNYVAWCWKAGGAAATNTNGTITSTVSANPDAGFSIVSFTSNGAASVVSTGHGLSVEPEMVIFKNRDNSSYWLTYHKDIGDNGYLALQDTFGTQPFTPFFDMTSTTIAVRQSSLASNNEKCIAYCFRSVDGYQKVGSYTGTGVSGNTVTTGFQPRFLITKRTDVNGYNWYMWDSIRNPANPRNKVFYADTDGAELDFSAYPHNFLSNGFSIDTTNAAFNGSGGTYIYLAIA